MTLATLEKRVRYWQNHPSLAYLGLGSWVIKVEWIEDTDGFDDCLETDDVLAACVADENFDEATVSFNEERMQDREDVDRIVVHELLHAFMRDFDEAQLSGLEKYMSVPAIKDFTERLRHEREGVVDRLARTIVALDKK